MQFQKTYATQLNTLTFTVCFNQTIILQVANQAKPDQVTNVTYFSNGSYAVQLQYGYRYTGDVPGNDTCTKIPKNWVTGNGTLAP